jgi:cyanophycinase-like exopeptidase
MSQAVVADSAVPDYQYYVAGNAGDVVRKTRGLIVLQGGGDDVDANYARMGEFGGGGDFVVLRASGKDEYNDYILDRCGCDSVETVVFADRKNAYAPEVLKTIRNAEALFIAGGDQSRYVRFWQGTPVEDAIHELFARSVPIGGTSAGMAILGEYVYSAMGEKSVVSEAALSDPYIEDLTLTRDFLNVPVLNGLITDQHLQERNRIGRTVVFMARLLQDGWTSDAKAIAADRETALHIDPASGIATVHASAGHETPYVYFLRASDAPANCEPGEPLSFTGIAVHRLGPGQSFDINAWQGTDGTQYQLDVRSGELSSSRGDAY